jgi:hypothetical protein
MVGEPNQKRYKTPLQSIPAFDELFRRITVDCVDPLLKTRSSKQYLLITTRVSTNCSEIIPLRNMKAKALIKFLTKFGLPKSVQTDQSLNFMSGILKKVMTELGVQQVKF